ncbi:MAG: hypothetical protein Q7T41_00595 [Candidatus Saccharibacteria bacterium]|nr:hypothetical protein [Candidatus Saccharibacteria bacterium]
MHIVELSTLSIIDLTTLTDKITVQSVVFKNTNSIAKREITSQSFSSS